MNNKMKMKMKMNKEKDNMQNKQSHHDSYYKTYQNKLIIQFI